MLINLYGNIINPYNITKVSTYNGKYVIYFNGIIDATSAQDRNYIEITPSLMAQVDGVEPPDSDVTFIQKVINKLWKAEADQKSHATSLMSNS